MLVKRAPRNTNIHAETTFPRCPRQFVAKSFYPYKCIRNPFQSFEMTIYQELLIFGLMHFCVNFCTAQEQLGRGEFSFRTLRNIQYFTILPWARIMVHFERNTLVHVNRITFANIRLGKGLFQIRLYLMAVSWMRHGSCHSKWTKSCQINEHVFVNSNA